jgi:crotonobetainyl-CoA:carnitine CoA-transferase CaiB-like acyl-CoA transferase
VGYLDEMKVVDATRLLPGGFATMLLADMGAEVVKIEQPGLGDYMRATPPTSRGSSPANETVNRNKKSIGINLKTGEGRLVLSKMLESSDVFIEGFRPGAMNKLGLSFDRVRRLNPRIIYCSISAFGQSNALSKAPGHDINFQAMAGALDYSGRGEVPLLQLSDMVAGIYAALAIVAAYSRRDKAVFIDIPITQSLLSWMVVPVSAYLATGVSPIEGHSLLFGSAPYYCLYRTSDSRYVAVAAIEEEFWHNLVAALNVPQIEHKRFGTKADRREVASTLRRVFRTKTMDEWRKILLPRETCATPVLSVGEAVDSDWARRSSMLVRSKGNGSVLNGPLRGAPSPVRSEHAKAPALGEHTETIMGSLGYSRDDVKRLRAKGVLQ